MNTSIIPDNSFDPIVLESKLQEEYEKSLKEREFCPNYQEQPHTIFEDGKYDEELDMELHPTLLAV